MLINYGFEKNSSPPIWTNTLLSKKTNIFYIFEPNEITNSNNGFKNE